MSSVIEVPDWYRTVALVGVDITGEPVVVLLDSTGAIMAVMKGEYAGTLKNIAVDASGRIVSVIRDPTSDNYIAIDANGYIAAVLKATYSGTLKNVACDSEGRIIMIPTDPADVWGNAISMGNAELAARLKPLFAYDYRGNIIWAADFESGLQGSTFGVDHADSIGILSSSRAFSGPLSLKLDPRGVDDAYVDWGRTIAFLSSGRVGFYTPISLDTDPSTVRWRMIYYDGSNALTAYLLYTVSTGNWTIVTPGVVWVTVLTGFKLYQGASAWHHIKLVIDPSTKKYVRALVDKQSVDLSAYSLVETVDTSLGQLLVSVRCNALAVSHAPIYIGGGVFTQNEPS